MKIQGEVYDMIGIGFGPANLALAVACEEAASETPLRHLFLEAKDSFVWHPGMLIEDSLLQISVLKDLILVENPRSHFTFLNYLKEQGRLYEFLNLRDLYPTRIEFNDYLRWAANQLDSKVRYGHEVIQISPISEQGQLDFENPQLLQITAFDHQEETEKKFICRHVVLAAGGRPELPPGVEPSKRIIHPHQFKQSIRQFDEREKDYRFVVVGGGQSAGEIFDYLIDHYPNADITATVRGFSYKPVDDSDFTNRIFFPEWVDYYHALPSDKRQQLFDSLKDVNYAAIDSPLIHRIYTKLYRQKVAGRERARLSPFMELKTAREEDGIVKMEFFNLMEETKLSFEVDGAVLCTGFSWPKEHPLLSELTSILKHDQDGGYSIGLDYRVPIKSADMADPEKTPKQSFSGPGIYMQGYCEETHGISETVLSLLPVRASKILRSVQKARLEQPQPVMT